MNWNSNNPKEWFGLYSTQAAILTVLCDDGNSDYVWIGTEGGGILFADDGENFEPAGGVIDVATPSGKGEVLSTKIGYSAKSETWTLTFLSSSDVIMNSSSERASIDNSTYWMVSGSLSGMQAGIAQTDQIYRSDSDEISFKIKEKGSAFQDGDKITISVTANKVGHGWTVWDIVKVPGTHGSTATLYAGTNVGVYKSINGGRTWDSTGRFTGDFITCLELYRPASGIDILYAGTQNGGVWVSNDSGKTWTQYATVMDKRANIKDILLDPTLSRLNL